MYARYWYQIREIDYKKTKDIILNWNRKTVKIKKNEPKRKKLKQHKGILPKKLND